MGVLAEAPAGRRPARVMLLFGGLVVYGFGQAILVVAGLGLDPWDVLHQGLSRTLGGRIGTWTILASAAVLLGWIPLRQRPGYGTVANAVVVGLALDTALDVLPTPHGLTLRIVAMLLGVAVIAVATAAYIGAGLGPGPRDGLMTGIAARGHSIRSVRTGIEVTVLVLGFALGGTVGVGTAIFALSIGPLVHVLIPLLTLDEVRPHAPTG